MINVIRVSLFGLAIILETIESKYLNTAENLPFARVLLHGDIQNYELGYVIGTIVGITVVMTLGLQVTKLINCFPLFCLLILRTRFENLLFKKNSL
jgi:hypothetical protein